MIVFLLLGLLLLAVAIICLVWCLLLATIPYFTIFHHPHILTMGVQEYLASHNVERSDVGPFLFIHTILSAILVGSTWGICYFAGKHPLPQSFMTSSKHEVPNSILLRSISKMPLLSDGLKRKACQAMVSAHLNLSDIIIQVIHNIQLDFTRACITKE